VNGAGALYPLGYEIQLYKGIVYVDGSTEYVSLGRFFLEKTVVKDDANGITLVSTLNDRAETISRAEFSTAYQTDGVSTADVAMKNLISSQVSGLTFSLAPSTYVPPVQVWTVGDDPFAAALSIALAAGQELYPDAQGVITSNNVLDPTTLTSVATYIEGTAAAPVGFARTLDNSNVPNIVCVVSSGSGVSVPIQTFWWDNNPASKTFYASGTPGVTLPARDVTSTYPTTQKKITTSQATTLAQAQAIANAAGLNFIGSFESALVTLRDNPAHDVNDVITLQRASAGVPSPTKYIIDQVVIDVGAQTPLQITARLVV
jgi:hypothetical protein